MLQPRSAVRTHEQPRSKLTNEIIRSLPKTATGRVMMDLTIDGQVITGTWTEETDPEGYYKSSIYSGAIHMLLDHTGHRMKGKWLGFNRDGGISDGPWVLDLISADTGKAAVEQYNRPVKPVGGGTTGSE